jgi:hypothetical protein
LSPIITRIVDQVVPTTGPWMPDYTESRQNM